MRQARWSTAALLPEGHTAPIPECTGQTWSLASFIIYTPDPTKTYRALPGK